jgi:hypothetical protein
VINVTPRYAKLLDSKGEVFGWENFELISGAHAGSQAGSSARLAAAPGTGRARVRLQVYQLARRQPTATCSWHSCHVCTAAICEHGAIQPGML